jgi:hypothetical protein
MVAQNPEKPTELVVGKIAWHKLYIAWSAAWIAFVLFGIHVRWGRYTQQSKRLIGTADFALIPPALGYLLFHLPRWFRRALRTSKELAHYRRQVPTLQYMQNSRIIYVILGL